ncbi:MAG: acetate kinase [Clostridiales bacterium]|jgi:acetate kinase|nr:acetate kinase [Clostridiales bacterium]
MIILVVNTGSSSLKYQLIDMDGEKVLAKGLCERIGEDGHMNYKTDEGTVFDKDIALPDHGVAMQLVIDALTDKEHGVISSMDEIGAVGHRIVQGGYLFDKSELITDEVEKGIEELCTLGPLHNPPALVGIRACKQVLPNTPGVVVFDTTFHRTMADECKYYAIPWEYAEKYHVQRYGAHGTSHRYVAERCAELMGKPAEELNIITCHLGNGSSISAVKGGKCYDTSMGLTPLEGLVMGTRCGSIDPTVVSFIYEQTGMPVKEITDMMTKKSGLLAISEISGDCRDICEAEAKGNKKAHIAREMLLRSVRRFIGAYAAELGHVDAMVFTAGIGENDIELREKVTDYLGFMGVTIDKEKNNCRGKEVEITGKDSKVRVFIIPTQEELMIARDTKAIVEAL